MLYSSCISHEQPVVVLSEVGRPPGLLCIFVAPGVQLHVSIHVHTVQLRVASRAQESLNMLQLALDLEVCRTPLLEHLHEVLRVNEASLQCGKSRSVQVRCLRHAIQ